MKDNSTVLDNTPSCFYQFVTSCDDSYINNRLLMNVTMFHVKTESVKTRIQLLPHSTCSLEYCNNNLNSLISIHTVLFLIYAPGCCICGGGGETVIRALLDITFLLEIIIFIIIQTLDGIHGEFTSRIILGFITDLK